MVWSETQKGWEMVCNREGKGDEDWGEATGLGSVTSGKVIPVDVGRRMMVSGDETRPREALLSLAAKGRRV